MLTLLWQVTPLSIGRMSRALHKLLPTAGWPLPPPDSGLPPPGSKPPLPDTASPPVDSSHAGSAAASVSVHESSDDSWLPLPSQQAEVVHMLLQQVTLLIAFYPVL